MTDREKIVELLLDEVYSSKRVEYSNGRFFGYEDEEATKTLLTFMVKSVAGRYSDVVAMVPVTKISAKLIKKWFDPVLEGLTKVGFTVVAVCSDAHSANRRFFAEELCDGKLKIWIPHPYKNGEKMFLLFDSVHIYKNLYNNLLNRHEFQCPNFDGEKLSANFEHVKDLYQEELGKSVKFAHKLSDKVIAPKPIERTKVELADRCFHESTIHALEWFANNGKPMWGETANFFKLVRRFWNAVNVKNPKLGIFKRDDSRRPITVNYQSQVEFLSAFLNWLEEWEQMAGKRGGLSKETFCAIRQTTAGLIQLSNYLLEEKHLSYVLLGLINSDPLEKRFGWYRQLSGANYYLSLKQFLEAEKKIRLKCLVQFAHLNIQEIQEVFAGIGGTKEEIDADVEKLYGMINFDSIHDALESDGQEGIMFYVAGYIVRGLLKKSKCDDCSSVLASSRSSPKLLIDGNDNEILESKNTFLEMINRGGLCTPSDAAYMVCVHAAKLKEEIFMDDRTRREFLSFNHPQAVFVETLKQVLLSSDDTVSLLRTECKRKHRFDVHFTELVSRFFNVMCKNIVAEINSELHENRKRKSNDDRKNRKISKLQSC